MTGKNSLKELLAKDEKEIELEKERGVIEKQKQRVINGFKKILGEENFQEVLNFFEMDRTTFTNNIVELFTDDEKLIKTSKEDHGTNRNFLSELNKNSIYKDTSKLQEKILVQLYKKFIKNLGVDYRGTIRWKDTSSDILDDTSTREKIPKYLFIIARLSSVIRNLNEEKRKLILFEEQNSLPEQITEIYKNKTKKEIQNLEKEMEEYLSKTKLVIKKAKNEKRLYKFLLFFLQIYQNLNESAGYLEILEILKKTELFPKEEWEINLLKSYLEDELKEYLKDKNKNKKITIEESYLSMKIYFKTVVKDYGTLTDINSINYIAFFEGIYLSQIQYNEKKLYSYVDKHRKSEFIMFVYEYLKNGRSIEGLIEFFFTEKEIKVYSSKVSQEELSLPKNKVEFQSMEVEDKFLPSIINIIINENTVEGMRKLEKITDYYVDIVKKHGEFINDQTLYTDVKLIIDTVYQYYLYSYLDFEVYQNLKKSLEKQIDTEKENIYILKKLLILKD